MNKLSAFSFGHIYCLPEPARLFIRKRTHTHLHSDVSQKPSTMYRRGRSMQMRPGFVQIDLFLVSIHRQTDWQPTCTIHIPSITYIFAMPAPSSLHTSLAIWRTEPEPHQFPSKRMRKRELIYTYLPLTTKWNCSSHRIAWIWTVRAFVHVMVFLSFVLNLLWLWNAKK